MVSHKHGLGVSITAKRGLHVFFHKKTSGFNECVAKKMRGAKGDRQSIRNQFSSAAKGCHGSK